jgi:hypothetical protein
VSTWVALEPWSSTVEAGGEAVVWLLVRNTGDVAEEYYVDVVGDPALWCVIEPTTIQISPGTTRSVRLTFAPPRSPDVAAGTHPYGVRVRSGDVADVVTVPEGNLSITPFADIRAELLPVTVRGWRGAKARLVVDNYGNTTVTASVVGAARSNRIDFDIRTPSFQVPPGRAHFSVLKLGPERPLWLGRKVSHPFVTTVRPSGSSPATVAGTYVQSVLLPTWMCLLVGLLAVVVTLWFATKPSVPSNHTAEVTTAPAVRVGPATPGPAPSPAKSHVLAHKRAASKAVANRVAGPAAAADAATNAATTHSATTVSLPGPDGWWKLNQTSGTTALDSSAFDHPANGFNTSWCPSENCALFNGSDSHFVADGPVLNTGAGASFTVAAWVWLYSVPSSGFATFVSQDGTTNSGFYLQFSAANNDSWAFSRVSSDSDNPADSYRAVSDASAGIQKWTYLVGVYNGAGNEMQLYVNGVLQDTTVTDPAPFSAAGNFVIGSGQYDGDPTDWVLGDIGDVETFQSALSGAQVMKLFADS